MTATALRLRRLGGPHVWARAAAVLLTGAGAVLAIAGLGLALTPRVAAIVAAWVAISGVVVAALWLARRAGCGAAASVVARLVETASGTRDGAVAGLLGTPPLGSAELWGLADRRASDLVSQAAPAVGQALRRGTRASLGLSAAAVALGGALFLAAAPRASGPRGAAFWHPWRTIVDVWAPVRLAVDRSTVRRGDSVTVMLEVPAGTEATLWTRGPGEPWRAAVLSLDSMGRATRRLGPLEADLYLRASSGGRHSAVQRVTVALPAFVTGLQLTARYPGYLARPDEPLVPGSDSITIPEGTVVLTTGGASVRLAAASWRRDRAGASGSRTPLVVRGSAFSGRLAPTASGVWRLELATADGEPLEGEAPALWLRVVPDSAPVVALPVPGRDTTLPLSLRQPLVVDARDDHGLTRLELVSWRVSQTGKVGAAVRESLDVSGAGERAIVQGEIDAERRGLLPGDTLRLVAEAWDNAPVPHVGRSPEIALRLPSLEELRAATRAATRDVAAEAESLAQVQTELGRRTGDLAQQRARDGGVRPSRPRETARDPTAPFQATERAQAVAREQEALQQRVQELARAVEQIAQAAQAAGINDTAFQARLREVQELLRRAITPELASRLRELQEALARLDSEAMRRALERLAEAQQQLKAELERSDELFRRAAVEGALASLAADAEELERRQAAWNREGAPHPDSAAAALERALAERADSLARGIDRVTQDLKESPTASPLGAPAQATRDAQAAMQRAARSADRGEAPAAAQAGAEAEQRLAGVPSALRGRRDSLAREWRRETLAALDRALSETADLAERQQGVAEALRRGEVGGGTRSQQASVEEGTDAVARQIRAAAGKHALVSPQLDAALGYAKRQMAATREQLEEADPNGAEAATLADESVDALNATALALARTRRHVLGAQSGSGFAEALEQLARLAGDQQGLNAQAQGLLPLMGMGGEAVLQQLRALAARQRALAEQLERLQAGGANSAAGALAQEAKELARQLEAGRLDRETVERQQRLYHRLLDAGRTLSTDEPDEDKERVSRPATGDSVHLPEVLRPGATGLVPRLRYPTWEQLQALTPEQRRLVLEYFRLLNEPGSPSRRQ
ncbi:MAG TPA: hypothetical protein VM716_07155 [Gemmatimonadales bacterium]|nr:hypothetical protein [Gemmatimonadales bacterium]